ncbi:MAG TPA: hypothetical protein VFY42_04020 [Gemmatimonadales bacterium]|jgi:hypothetical protein|nr:hypothetical protein [Gemmatimonadales bacterium]
MAVKQWSWTAILVVGVLTGAAWARQAPPRHWLGVNGADWRRMGPEVRAAYVEGFLAGAALGQAATGARDSTGVRMAIERLSRDGGLRFAYGANVYSSRITDFYWWENHVPLPTWHAFLEVNTALGRPVSDTLP